MSFAINLNLSFLAMIVISISNIANATDFGTQGQVFKINEEPYAAILLAGLKQKHGNWHKAVRYYHSANGEHHRKYSRKVVLSWING